MPKKHLYKKALTLEYVNVTYNVLEAIASIFFGLASGSIALIGFGMDSIVESLSGMILIWRLKQSGEKEARAEKKAVRLVGYSFFILGAYVLYESVSKLVTHEMPEPSIAGIVIAVLSIILMPTIARMKRRIGEQINSRALIYDSRQTWVCSFLSVALLIGLGLNLLFGFWWADPITGLIIVGFLFKEGWETL